MAGGRPTKYEQWMCDAVIERGRHGDSNAQMAGHIQISKDTLYRWESENKEFSDALTYARTLSQIWWENKGKESLDNQHFQSAVYNKAMPARFPDDYREKKEVAHEFSLAKIVADSLVGKKDGSV